MDDCKSKQKRGFIPRRKKEMIDSVYKYFLGFVNTVGVGALIWIANDVTQIKTIVYNERVVVGKLGQDVKSNTAQILTNKVDTNKRLSLVEERVIEHVINNTCYK